jgi:hypothetical protein
MLGGRELLWVTLQGEEDKFGFSRRSYGTDETSIQECEDKYGMRIRRLFEGLLRGTLVASPNIGLVIGGCIYVLNGSKK